MSAIILYSIFIAVLYSILFIFLLIKWRFFRNFPQTIPGEKRFISVVVAYKNEKEGLLTLLDSISNQTYRKDLFEILLVDDYSTTQIEINDKRFKGFNIFWLKNQYSPGKKYALKTGIENSKGDIILTTDADCSPGKNWIKTAESLVPKSKLFILSMPVFFNKPRNLFSGMQALEFSSLVGVGAASFTAGNPIMCNGANLAFSKSLFLKSFNNIYPDIPTGDDIFLMLEGKKNKKCKLLFGKNRDVVVYTRPSDTISDFIKQRKRWASKAMLYRDPFLVFSSLFVLLFNLGLLILFFGGIFNNSLFQLFIFLFVVKFTVDFLFLFGFLEFFKKLFLLKFFLPSQFLYPFYIISSAIAGIIKGKKYYHNNE